MAPKKRKKRRLGRPSRCNCGGPKVYAACCKPFHTGESTPATPVDLMKSRYTAYARGLAEYIMNTTDPDGPAWEEDVEAWRASIARFTDSFEFTGVKILNAEQSGDEGTVTFRAGLRADEQDASFEETSRFVRTEARWLYSSGDVQD